MRDHFKPLWSKNASQTKVLKPSDGFGAFKLVNVSARTNRVVVEAFICYHWNLEATIS